MYYIHRKCISLAYHKDQREKCNGKSKRIATHCIIWSQIQFQGGTHIILIKSCLVPVTAQEQHIIHYRSKF